MKKLVASLVIALVAIPVMAQSQQKPSAGIRDSASREHRLPAQARQNVIEQEAPPLRTTVARSEYEIPIGTAIRFKLETPLSTAESKPGDTFSGRVSEPVIVGRRQVIPAGASVSGHVERASEPRRIAGKPTLAIRPDYVELPDGEKIVLNAMVVDTSDRKLSVDDEGRIKGSGFNRRDAVQMTLGTGGGAGVGAILAGAKGTLVGAGVGAAAGTTMWLARRHSFEIPAGTELILELNRPAQLLTGTVHSGY